MDDFEGDFSKDYIAPVEGLIDKLDEETRAIKTDFTKRIRDEIRKHNFPDFMNTYQKDMEDDLDDVGNYMKKVGLHISNDYPTVGEFVDAVKRYYDEAREGMEILGDKNYPP